MGRACSFGRSSLARLSLVVMSCVALCLVGWLTALAGGPAGGWTELAPLPEALAQAAAVTLPDGRIVVTGGSDSTGLTRNNIRIYDPGLNQWTTSGSHLNTARKMHAAALAGDGKIYVFGGMNGSSWVSSVETFDFGMGVVQDLGSSGCITRARMAAVTLNDGHIMLIGGNTTDNTTSAVEFFDSGTGKCTPATTSETMPTARTYLSAVLGAEGLVYAIGGFANGNSQSLVEIYDPSAHSWSTGTPMPEARIMAAAASGPDGKIYVIGGESTSTSSTTYYKSVLRYDPATKSWETLSSSYDLPAPRMQLAAAVTANRIVAIGGFESGSTKTDVRKDVYALNFEVAPPDGTAPMTTLDLAGPHNNDDWFTGEVTVTLSASDNDGGSGIKEINYTLDDGARRVYSEPFSVAGDGDHTVSFWSVDNAGNAETAQSQSIRIDGTAPDISAEVQDAHGALVNPKAGDWLTGPLTITFTCADNTSGIDANDPSACQGTSRLEDGRNLSISGEARDRAGNMQSFLLDGINVGDPRPLIDYVLQDGSGAEIEPNADGWFNQAVTVHFRCSWVAGNASSCGPDVRLPEGADQIVTGVALDDQGHSNTVTTAAINVDLTKPAYTHEFRDSDGRPIVANSAGWFNQAVTVHIECSDSLSGVVDCPADETITDTTGRQFSAMIHDRAGNETLILIENINVDSDAPVVICPAADDVWHDDDVIFTCQATDDGSNVNAEDASFTLTTSVPDESETDQAATDSRTVCDRAGNCATPVQITGVRVDKLAPTVQIDSPSGSYPQGAVMAASFHCDDGGSGIVSCAGTVADGDALDTSTPGDHSFVVTAVDGVGHQTVQTVSYTVLEAPANPGDDDPPLESSQSRYRVGILSGSTLTVKRGYWAVIRVELWDNEQDAAAAARLKIDAIDVSPASAQFTAPGNLKARFQYSRALGKHGGYQLALNTRNLKPGEYVLRFIVEGDSTIQQFTFLVR